MIRIVIGIDPGKNGGIAWFDVEGGYHAVKMPPTERDLWELVSGLENYCHEGTPEVTAYVERVGGQKPGVCNVTAISKLQYNYGQCRMAVLAAGYRLEDPTPRTWQKAFGLIRTDKNESDIDKKNRHKAKAQELFPTLKITHAISDALLIAEYGRRMQV